MKRKLVNEDLLKVKKLLNELHINGERVTIDLTDLTVETSGELPEDGDSGEVSPEGLDLQSEEEVIAEVLAKSEVPEQTGLRYLQRFWEYFETDREQIINSHYNVKLLQAIDHLFSKGMAPEEVKTVLDDGNSLFSSISESSREMAREYFDSMEPLNDYEEKEDEEDKTDWTAKAGKLGLVALAVLFLVAIGSYQLGFLRPLGIYPGSGDSFEGVVNERADGEQQDEQEAEDAGEAPNGEEIADPVVPALMPEDITVNILNGSGAPGVAGRFGDELERAGYEVVDVDNADSFDYSRSQVISRLEGDEALEVLAAIPQAELLFEAPREDKTMITVILGADYVD